MRLKNYDIHYICNAKQIKTIYYGSYPTRFT